MAYSFKYTEQQFMSCFDLLKNSSLAGGGDLIAPVASTSEGQAFVNQVVLVFSFLLSLVFSRAAQTVL